MIVPRRVTIITKKGLLGGGFQDFLEFSPEKMGEILKFHPIGQALCIFFVTSGCA